MPTRPWKASNTGKPRSPGSKYAFSRCWNSQSGSWFAWPGRWNLAVLPRDAARSIDQNGSVEAPLPVALVGELGVAEVETHFELACQLEERGERRVRHLGFVEGIELRLVLHPPAGEEGGERELGEHDEPGAPSVGFAHHLHHAGDRGLARLAASDWTHLGGSDADLPAHGARVLHRVLGDIPHPTAKTAGVASADGHRRSGQNRLVVLHFREGIVEVMQ